MSVQKTQKQYIEDVIKVHGNKYDLSKINYTKSINKIEVVCYKHGSWFPVAGKFLCGSQCPKCAINKGYNTENWIEKAKEIHGDKYDYSKVYYIDQKTKVIIICFIHGEFKQNPHNHINGCGCKKCSSEKFSKQKRRTTEEFINLSKEIHGDKYDYSKVNYKNIRTKIKIICKKHGIFNIRPDAHLKGDGGCRKCSVEKDIQRKLPTLNDFIKKSEYIHNNKYDYSEVVYTHSQTKVKLFCNKCKKYFFMTPASHLQGQNCRCYIESKGEEKVKEILENYNINYKPQQTFEKCRNPKTNTKLKFDFYLKDLNTCIEYDGKQHYESVEYWGGEEGLEKLKYRDSIKNTFCKENDITLLRIPYTEYNNIEHILKNNIGIGTNLL